MEYDKDERKIISDKEISNLDKFALDFLRILEKHVNYVVISGYVSIILGRTRVTEDIDVFIKRVSGEQFSRLYIELQKKGFWCLNAEDEKKIFSYLNDGLAVRFSYENNPVPNFEIKFPKDELDESAFEDFITVIIPGGKLKISSLERHIAFKKYYLGSDKDIEDALHIEELFKEKIDYDKINKLRQLIRNRQKTKWLKKKKEFF